MKKDTKGRHNSILIDKEAEIESSTPTGDGQPNVVTTGWDLIRNNQKQKRISNIMLDLIVLQKQQSINPLKK